MLTTNRHVAARFFNENPRRIALHSRDWEGGQRDALKRTMSSPLSDNECIHHLVAQPMVLESLPESLCADSPNRVVLRQ
uniref:Uncharacterized protein n=1 Tax=Mycena chlorophos TaxID=658473 RepID=A0ABQ0LG53_MYCCL|nr:predicted protein [Mycena chlorophos]